jgi:class 3 adenylate cyclase
LASVALTSILITDLVGSTGLESSVGPARADELRWEHFAILRKAIAATGGREIKNMGDGLMVAFPSSSAAVACAVRMQQLMEQRNRFTDEHLHMRIGIGAGEATVSEGDYFGMPTIEAARLCDKAPGDGILASPLARMAAGRTEGLSFESAGAMQLNGIPGPIEAFTVGWELLGANEQLADPALPTQLRSTPPIAYVGRVEERERLSAWSRQARDGVRRAVFITGEPGIGKTRLAAHTALEAHAAGSTVCWGVAAEDLRAPYGPWIQALSHYVDHAPEEVLAAHVERHGGELARLVRGSLTRRMPHIPPPGQAEPETERYLLFEAVAGLLHAASEHNPSVLVLDDLQWADAQTLSLLKHVVTSTPASPLLVLASCRESNLDRDHPLRGVLAELRRVEGVERLPLRGLDVEDIAEVMAAAAGHEMDTVGVELAREIGRETDGNPFFVAELLRHLSESGEIAQRSDGRWQLRLPIAKLALPPSLREVICHRAQRLGEHAEQILTLAAVIGRTFDVEFLELLVDGDEGALLEELERGVQASLLVESPVRVARFSFAHALINHALYDAVGPTRRRRLHRRVAEALEELCSDEAGERLVATFLEDTVGSAAGSAVVLAHHWSEADDEERAVHYLLAAAKQTAARGREAEAVDLYNQALGLIPEGESDRWRDVQMQRALAYARFTHTIGGDTSDVSQARRAAERRPSSDG